MAVTIKDVAALAGVSSSTVSRTCKNNPSISEETKEKVRRAMAQLGYEPNFQASNLASQNSRTIGIILPVSAREAYENSFYLEAIRGISQLCNKRQYINTVITGESEEEVLQVIKTMARSGQVDGFIVLYSRQDDPIADFLYNEGFLYVLVGKAYSHANQTIYIDNDNLLAAQEATEYLYQMGHRRIGYIGSDTSMIFSADRKSGYQTALLQHNILPRADYCVEMTAAINAGGTSASSTATEKDSAPLRCLLSLPDRPTAVVVSDDILAATLERVCLEMGLSIPEDLSIVSFNNSLFARLASPQLTSVDINSFQLGAGYHGPFKFRHDVFPHLHGKPCNIIISRITNRSFALKINRKFFARYNAFCPSLCIHGIPFFILTINGRGKVFKIGRHHHLLRCTVYALSTDLKLITMYRIYYSWHILVLTFFDKLNPARSHIHIHHYHLCLHPVVPGPSD